MTLKKAAKIFVPIAVVGIITVLILVSSSGGKEPTYTFAKVEKGKIVQTVSETGEVKAGSELNLSFLNSGQLKALYVAIGDEVEEGALLAELDYGSLEIKQREAQASLDLATADYNKLLHGATREEIAVATANANQAKTAYDAAVREYEKIVILVDENIVQAQKLVNDLESDSSADVTSYEQAIVSAETNLANTKSTSQKAIDNSIDNAISTMDDKLATARTALDAISRLLNDDDADNALSLKNPIYLSNTNSKYSQADSLLLAADADLDAMKIGEPDRDDIILMVSETKTVLQTTFDALVNCFQALENSVTSLAFSQTDVDSYKASISSQQTIIAGSISSVQGIGQTIDSTILAYENNISSAEASLNQAQANYDDALRTAKNSLINARLSGDQQLAAAESRVDSAKDSSEVAQAELSRIKASASSYDVALAQARIKQAEAALNAVNRQIEDSQIKAPIKGTITKVDFEIGEQVSPANSAISMLGENHFQIEVLISETDIAKLAVDDQAVTTLDAFGDEVEFLGKVFFVEPAETEVADVVYYKVSVEFDAAEYEIKSGMTANVVITTAEKDDVLTIPSRAVVDREGVKMVRYLENGELKEKEISVGIRGDEGTIEVLKGVKEGEEIVTFVKENGKK